jgi:hypothetical protein
MLLHEHVTPWIKFVSPIHRKKYHHQRSLHRVRAKVKYGGEEVS